MTEQHDISIVGGGPAGSYTAFACLRQNPEADVAIYDTRKVIGKPVNCAGGIVTFWLDKLGITLPKKVVAQPIRGLRIVGPRKQVWEHHQDDIGDDRDIGYVMDRQKFDQWNLDRAKRAGATVHLGENPALWDQPYHFPGSRYVIGADGWKSGLATHYGLPTEVADHEMHVGWEYRIRMPEYDQDYITFFLADQWAPEGYVWAFPEGGDIVKIGLGIPKSYRAEGRDRTTDVRGFLRRFLDDFPEYDCERVERAASGSGMIPTSKPLPEIATKVVRGGEFWLGVVGDAARMVDPLHGGGISTAMLAARIAGTVISKEQPLDRYQKIWDREERPELMRRYAMKEALTQWENPELNRMMTALEGFQFESSAAPAEAARMILHVVRKAPRLFTTTAAKTLRAYASVKF